MNADIQKKFRALHAAYAKNLPNKIAAIKKQWKKLQQQWDKQAFVDFHREVHSLCGSSGTYGYIALSKAARNLEMYLKPLLNNTSIFPQQDSDISERLKQLESMLSEPPSEQAIINNLEISIIPNNIVYILDSDAKFIADLHSHFNETGYKLCQINNLAILKKMTHDNPPAALIIDIDRINDNDLTVLTDLKHQQQAVIPLFCIAANGDILTRLKAVRMGCSAFFQKPVEPFFLTKKLDQLSRLSPPEPYRILIIDDSISLAEYYALVIKEAGMISYFITNPLKLIEAIENFQPDLLLMDIYMPQCSGLELAAVLRQEPQYTKLPIIFLSTEDDRFKQLSALNLGGDDFLVKPIEPEHLIKAILSRAKRAGTLSSFMCMDSLTGLLNHTNILQRLSLEIASAERRQETVSFIMLDIDFFKRVNDEYGHSMGDTVIKKISTFLMTFFRKMDIVGRYGGEEFAIVLPKTSSENAFNVCERLRIKFSEYIFKDKDIEFSVTLSAGIASYPKIKDINAIVTAADQALYTAKHQGRNQVVIFDPDLPSTTDIT